MLKFIYLSIKGFTKNAKNIHCIVDNTNIQLKPTFWKNTRDR